MKKVQQNSKMSEEKRKIIKSRILLLESEDEDEAEDELLSFQPFGKSPKRKLPPPSTASDTFTESDNSVSGIMISSPIATSNYLALSPSSIEKTQIEETDKNKNSVKKSQGDIDYNAQQKAKSSFIPDHLRSVKELAWWTYGKGGMKSVQTHGCIPVRICKAEEATGLDSFTNSKSLIMVEELVICRKDPTKSIYKSAFKNSLYPLKPDSLKDDNIWETGNQKFFNFYKKRFLAQKVSGEENRLANIHFLNFIQDHLKKKQAEENLKIIQEQTEEENRERDRKEWEEAEGEGEDQDEDDVPYTQAFTDDNLNIALDFSEKPKEPLRAGDVIRYSDPIKVAGVKHGIITTTVIAVEPKGQPILTVESGGYIPNDTYVKRIKVKKYGKLRDHPNGISRLITEFKLIKSGDKQLINKGFCDEINQVVDKHLGKLAEKTDGAYAGLIHKSYRDKIINETKKRLDKKEDDNSDSLSDRSELSSFKKADKPPSKSEKTNVTFNDPILDSENSANEEDVEIISSSKFNKKAKTTHITTSLPAFRSMSPQQSAKSTNDGVDDDDDFQLGVSPIFKKKLGERDFMKGFSLAQKRLGQQKKNLGKKSEVEMSSDSDENEPITNLMTKMQRNEDKKQNKRENTFPYSPSPSVSTRSHRQRTIDSESSISTPNQDSMLSSQELEIRKSTPKTRRHIEEGDDDDDDDNDSALDTSQLSSNRKITRSQSATKMKQVNTKVEPKEKSTTKRNLRTILNSSAKTSKTLARGTKKYSTPDRGSYLTRKRRRSQEQDENSQSEISFSVVSTPILTRTILTRSAKKEKR